MNVKIRTPLELKFFKRFDLIKTLKETQEAIDEIDVILKAETALAGGLLDFGNAGCMLNECHRETIDKKKAKKLLGELQYNQIVSIPSYSRFSVVEGERWRNFKITGRSEEIKE